MVFSVQELKIIVSQYDHIWIILKLGRQVLSEALEAKGARKLPFLPILSLFKNNVFPHFCAGETLQDCKAFYDRHRPYNIRVIVDHSKYVLNSNLKICAMDNCNHCWCYLYREEDERPEAHAFNLSEKIKLLRDAKSCLGDGVLFVPVKVVRDMSISQHIMVSIR